MSFLNKRNLDPKLIHNIYNPLSDSPDRKTNHFYSPNHYFTKYKFGGFNSHIKFPQFKVDLPLISNHQSKQYKSSTKLNSFNNSNSNDKPPQSIKPYYSLSNSKENNINYNNNSKNTSLSMKVSSDNSQNELNVTHETHNKKHIETMSNVSSSNNVLKRRQNNFPTFNHILSSPKLKVPYFISKHQFKGHSPGNKSSLYNIPKPLQSIKSFNEISLYHNKKQTSLTSHLIDNVINNINSNDNNSSNHNKDDSIFIKASPTFIRHFEVSQNGKNSQGKLKTNQDTYVMIDSLLDLGDSLIYGVMDGHGVNGHLVSKYVKDCIIEHFTNRSTYTPNKKQKFLINTHMIYKKLTENNYSLLTTFSHNIHDNIQNQSKFDCNFSGTTMNLIFQISSKLISCNVGDSRSIIISYHPYDTIQYKVEAFTSDHKPDNDDEHERIISKGGEIYSCEDETLSEGIKRIWVKNQSFPGIAISRTIGDLVAHSVGVIATPEFKERDIVDDKICIVVSASDGVWEFLSNERVKDIVLPFYYKNDVKGAANEIVKEASLKWKEEGLGMDDITCVVVFLNKQKTMI